MLYIFSEKFLHVSIPSSELWQRRNKKPKLTTLIVKTFARRRFCSILMQIVDRFFQKNLCKGTTEKDYYGVKKS